MSDKKWHLMSPDGKFLYSSVEDAASNKPAYYLNKDGVFVKVSK